MGLYACVSNTMRSADRRESRIAVAYHAGRLFLLVCYEFQKWNPDLLQHAVPHDVRDAEVAMNLVDKMLLFMARSQPARLSNEAVGNLFAFLRTYVEETRSA